MNKIKAVVIDDEFAARRIAMQYISELNPAFEIVGEAENIRSGFDLINEQKPGVVFLDIRMPDGSGFDLLNKFETIFFEVVFISGFDSYALKAFEYNALDYVLKPIDSEKFVKTLAKVESKITLNSESGLNIKSTLESYDLEKMVISKIQIHSGNKVVLLPLNSLLFVRSEDGSSQFKNSAGEIYHSAKQLSDFDFIFESYTFLLKINKGTYINTNYIKSYTKGLSCKITLTDDSVFEVSRRKKSEILELLSLWKK